MSEFNPDSGYALNALKREPPSKTGLRCPICNGDIYVRRSKQTEGFLTYYVYRNHWIFSCSKCGFFHYETYDRTGNSQDSCTRESAIEEVALRLRTIQRPNPISQREDYEL